VLISFWKKSIFFKKR